MSARVFIHPHTATNPLAAQGLANSLTAMGYDMVHTVKVFYEQPRKRYELVREIERRGDEFLFARMDGSQFRWGYGQESA